MNTYKIHPIVMGTKGRVPPSPIRIENNLHFMQHSKVEFGIALFGTAVRNPINPRNAAHSAKILGNCQKDETI